MLKYLVTFLILALNLRVVASTNNIVRSSDKIGSHLSVAQLVEIPTAKLVYVNYDLLAHDFPDLRQRSQESLGQWKSRLDQWLLTRSFFFRRSHFLHLAAINKSGNWNGLQRGKETASEWHDRVAQFLKTHGAEYYNRIGKGNVNTLTFPNWDNKATGFVPSNYNRAHLMSVEDGLLDIKGSGTNHPSHLKKRDGLLSLNEAIREVIMEQTVQMILQHAGSQFKTVGNYGIIDWGFNIIFADGGELPAGAVIRQATIRDYSEKNSQLPRNIQIEVERILRRYGLTSTGDTLALKLRGALDGEIAINLQGSLKNDIIDFGHITSFNENDFLDKKVLPLGEPNPGEQIKSIFVEGLEKTFDPKLRVPQLFHQIGSLTDPINDGLYANSRDLAWSLRKNFSRSHVEDHFATYLGTLDAVLTKATKNWYISTDTCRQFYSR